MELVEKVAERFKADLGAQLNATPLHHPNDWAASGGEINMTDLARAAIAEVFDWLAEPGDAAIEMAAWEDGEHTARVVWSTILAAQRSEALGE